MPGPVSDSYDPEFGTTANAAAVCDAIDAVRIRVTEYIGSEHLRDIVELAQEAKNGRSLVTAFSERELRIIRFCLDRAKESI